MFRFATHWLGLFCWGFLFLGSTQGVSAQQHTLPPVEGVGMKYNLSPLSFALGGATLLTNYNTTSELSNPANVAFSPHKYGGGVVYNPWITGVQGGDMFNITASGFYKFSENQGVYVKGSFFNIGQVDLLLGDPSLGGSNTLPAAALYDWNALAGYSLSLGSHIGIAADVRFFQSQKVASVTSSAPITYASANVVAGDLYVLYHSIPDSNRRVEFQGSFGLVNLGTKAEYAGIRYPYFIPSYMAIAGGVSVFLGENTLRFIGEVKKDLVPYGPKMSASQEERDSYNQQSVFQSWATALGQPTLGVSLGAEYIFFDQIFLRVGYMNDNFSYNTRDAYTFGLGYTFPFGLSLNCSYRLQGNSYASSIFLPNTFSVGMYFDM